jgi:hypothetical protein
MSLVGVVIDIAAEYTGAPAFKKASQATTQLERGLKKLGVTQKLAFAALTAGALAYSKKATEAAMKDQQAQALLANQLKNVGLAYAAIPVERFIKSMQDQTGILDDQLRPAFSELARVTGSVLKTQNLMTLAFNVSKGAGVEYSQVINDLSQAYVGNLKGLKKYDLGLTQAELTAMSFAQIQDLMAKNFAGAGAASLDTYAGKMSLLQVSLADASETIGGSLLDNMSKLAGNNGISGVQTSIDKLALGFSDVINGARVIGEKIMQFKAIIIPAAVAIGAAFFPVTTAIAAGVFLLSKLGSKNRIAKNNVTPAVQAEVDKSNAAKAAAAEKAAEKRNKELAKLAKQQTQAIKDQAKIKQSSAIFDLQQIQIVAALKKNISEEERTKLELQSALLMGNVSEATRLIKELASAQGITQELRTWLLTLPTAKNPFEAWMSYLDAIQKKAATVLDDSTAAVIANAQARIDTLRTLQDRVNAKIAANEAEKQDAIAAKMATLSELQAKINAKIAGNNYSNLVGTEVPGGAYAFTSPTGQTVNVNVSLDGNVFDNAVVGVIQNANRSGISTAGSASG